MYSVNLESLFEPEKIAVIGASRQEGKTGHEIFDNLLHDFEGEVVPVNPKADKIHGIKAEPDIPKDTDLAVIAVPAKTVPEIIYECGKKKVEAAIIISSGFSESGNEQLQEHILNKAEENNVTILGPNTIGLINTENRMNASFAPYIPERGKISLITQSGSFTTSILDKIKTENLGFNHIISLGNKSMLKEEQIIQYLDKKDTSIILSYTEGISDGRRFIEQTEKITKKTPIVMFKSGRTQRAGIEISKHTGTDAGSYENHLSAFKKAGIIHAESIDQLLEIGRALETGKTPKGDKIAVLTNSGSAAVTATDQIYEDNLELANLEMDTKRSLRNVLDQDIEVRNPLNLLGDSKHQRYKEAIEHCIEDKNVDTILTIITPQSNTDIQKTVKTIIKASKKTEKPIIASLMGEKLVKQGKQELEKAAIPEFQNPEDAIKVTKKLRDYKKHLDSEKTFKEFEYEQEKAEESIKTLEDYESREKLLESYKISLPLTKIAETSLKAKEAASKVGYPVKARINSPDITYKERLGGVKENLDSKKQVEKAVNEINENISVKSSESEIKGFKIQEQLEGLELSLTVERDNQFGPVVKISAGDLQKINGGGSSSIAPVSEQESERMIKELRIFKELEKIDRQKYNPQPVKDTIKKLGDLALNHEEIKEITIHPAILKGDKLYAEDFIIKKEDL